MKIIVGLGNPGEKYKLTRHNIGFSVVDALAEKYSQSKWLKKFNGLYCKCWSKNQTFLILKPETFMNNSGLSVGAITTFYKLESSKIIVIHDDLDLGVGQIKVKVSGGHAGHNGLKSIHQAIGDQYTRIRIGIGRPKEKTQVSSYVLSNFTSSENVQMDYYKKSFISGVNAILHDDYKNFISAINTKLNGNSKPQNQKVISSGKEFELDVPSADLSSEKKK